MNPNEDSEKGQRYLADEIIGVEGALVTNARSHSGGDNIRHHVLVKPDTFEESIVADVRVSQIGDVCIPEEGDRVTIAYRPNGRAFVVGSRYSDGDSIPDFDPGERVVGHPASNSYVRLHSDGTVTIEGDSGNTVELASNGDVIVNGGNTQPLTDIDFTNETVTRADSVYVPSQ